MSNPTNVPVFDLEAFKESTLALGFELLEYEADGTTLVGPYDLTNKTVTIIVRDIFTEDYELGSDMDPGESLIEIDADPTTGKFTLTIHRSQLMLAKHPRGHWWMTISDTDAEPITAMRGSFNVISVATGGPI